MTMMDDEIHEMNFCNVLERMMIENKNTHEPIQCDTSH